MISTSQRRSRRCCRPARLIKTATAAAFAAVGSVAALQPQSQPINPKLATRTSTALDLFQVGTPATEEDTNKTLQRLEELLKVELSMERQLPVEIGVTMASPNSAATAAPPAMPAPETSSKKRQPKRQKRFVTISGKAKKVATKRRTAASPSKTTSRLSAVAERKTKKVVKQRKRNSLDSVYWVQKDKKQVLLTREEEIVLTERIRALRRVEHIRDEHLHDQTPFTESQWATACGFSSQELRKVIKQGQDARSELVQANMGLVTSIAKRHHLSLKHATEAGNGVGTILTLQDCLQEGQIGLIMAAERFDSSRSVRFSTYATWWIRQRIVRSISDSSRIIRLPAHVHSKLMKIRKAKVEMQQQIGREPSLPEVAHYLEMDVEKVRQYTQSSINVVSLENPLRPTGNGKNNIDTRTIGDTIVSDAPTPFEDAQHESLKEDVKQVLLEALTSTERSVIWARYGLEDGDSKTLEETSRLLGLSRERVRLVEAKALNKLRSPQKNYRLKTYVGGSLNGNAGAKSPASKKKCTKMDAPWLTESCTENKKVDTTNPFASPMDYSSMVKERSNSSKETIGHTQRHGNDNSESPTPDSAAPDRLWFF